MCNSKCPVCYGRLMRDKGINTCTGCDLNMNDASLQELKADTYDSTMRHFDEAEEKLEKKAKALKAEIEDLEDEDKDKFKSVQQKTKRELSRIKIARRNMGKWAKENKVICDAANEIYGND